MAVCKIASLSTSAKPLVINLKTNLNGNCTAKKAYDFSLQNYSAQKVMNFKKHISKACLEPKCVFIITSYLSDL